MHIYIYNYYYHILLSAWKIMSHGDLQMVKKPAVTQSHYLHSVPCPACQVGQGIAGVQAQHTHRWAALEVLILGTPWK